MIRRLQLGQHVRLLAETDEGCELEGEARLCPGQVVDLVKDPDLAAPTPWRTAYVLSWFIVRLGRTGPVYQGQCHWQ